MITAINSTMAQLNVANHAQVERKFLRYAMQKLGTETDDGNIDIGFGELFTGLKQQMFV